MKKIILDCDPGMDDSMAIVMAVKSPVLDLQAVTTVSGNYPVDITSKNALKVLELLKRTDIPVGRGLEHPLVRKRPADPFTHGKDGQAENFLPEPAGMVSEEHAVDMIIRTVRDNPGEITVICTGPLSNLAMAFDKAPEIIPLIDQVIAISGAFGLNESSFVNATGDTPTSEWNVYVDPEAADIVYRSGVRFTAIGLDVAANFGVDFSSSDIQMLEKSGCPEAHFLRQAIKFVNERGFQSYCTVIDCMAVACAADPALISTKAFHVGIETKDGLTLGMTVRDARHHHVWDSLPTVNVATEADYEKFLKLLMETVLAEKAES
jgi:inosine-uridine nucleoside N-ribohydrolase